MLQPITYTNHDRDFMNMKVAIGKSPTIETTIAENPSCDIRGSRKYTTIVEIHGTIRTHARIRRNRIFVSDEFRKARNNAYEPIR